MIDLTNEMVLQPDAVIERLKGEVEAKEAELARLQKLEAEMSKPTITAEQVAAYQQQRLDAEMKAQEACKKALMQLAESHGYIIVAMPMASAEGRIVMVAADWGLQRKQ